MNKLNEAMDAAWRALAKEAAHLDAAANATIARLRVELAEAQQPKAPTLTKREIVALREAERTGTVPAAVKRLVKARSLSAAQRAMLDASAMALEQDMRQSKLGCPPHERVVELMTEAVLRFFDDAHPFFDTALGEGYVTVKTRLRSGLF
ncbi:MAG: hypothetical protein LAO51_04485 [Acidobacteriia bacterium]|nr:hypothetical protein [Terriglobia bacterium]